MDILFAVTTTHKYHDRMLAIANTWGKDKNIIFFSEEEFEYSPNKKTIKVMEEIPYDKGVLKLRLLIKLLYEKYNLHQWYMLTDDDTYVNYCNLEKYLKNQDINNLEAHGHLLYPHLSGGAGIIFNNKTLNEIKDFHNFYRPENQPYADQQLSYYLEGKKVKITHNPLQHPGNLNNNNCNENTKASTQDIQEFITLHYITPEKMYFLHNKLN